MAASGDQGIRLEDLGAKTPLLLNREMEGL